MRYRLIRLVILIVAPYWYLKMHLTSTEERPSDYFLRLLSEKKGRGAKVVLFAIVLSLAAINFDALMVLRAIRSLKSPIPLWALSARDIRLLFEATLWLRARSEFDTVKRELLRQSEVSSQVRSVLSFYDSFAHNEAELINTTSGRFVLPGLFWDRVAVKAFSEGRVRESLDALHQALQFIPEDDPRRAELVARYHQADVILSRYTHL